MTFFAEAGSRLTTWLLVGACIVAAITLIYWPGLGGGFIFDDFQNLLENPGLRVAPGQGSWLQAAFSSPSSELQRPLAMLSFAANHYFTGYAPLPMKLTNMAIHAANALLTLALLRLVVSRAAPERATLPIAGFATAAWAVHPINLMPVLYVVQRMESLADTFVLAGLIAYCIGRERMRARRPGAIWLALALVAFPILGVTAKESAVLLPLYALVLELVLYRFKDADGRGDWRLQAAFVVLLVVPALLGGAWLLSQALGPGAFGTRDYGPWERMLTEGRVVFDYLHWILLPDLGNLSLYHDDYHVSRGLLDPPATLAAWLGLAALWPLAWWLRKRRPLTALGIGWFLCAHVLTASFVPLDLAYEHRNYFASLGICLALADLALAAPDTAARRRLGAAVATFFLAFLCMVTWLRASEWSDPLRFAESEAAKHPNSPRATYEAARMLVIAGNYDPVSPYTRRAELAVERAMRVPGGGALPAQAALMLAARTGKPLQERWWQQLRDRVRENPGAPENQLSLHALTRCAISGGCDFPVDQMLSTFQAGLERGDDPGVLSTFGNYALNALGDEQLAFRLFQEAASRSPRNAQYQLNFADLAIAMGRYREAEAAIEALRREGRFGQYSQLADALELKLAARRRADTAIPAVVPRGKR